MAEDKGKQLQPVDLVGIGNLLEDLIVKDVISCEERDRIIQRIIIDQGIPDYKISILAGYQRSKDDVLKRAGHKNLTALQEQQSDDSYISLTDIVRAHGEGAPGYVIQSWMRSGNTLAFLNLWEKENNPDYCEDGYKELLEKKKAASFTLTPRLWISLTKAIGITSKQGKSGGTFAHPMISCEFASWLVPEFKILLLKLSLGREQLK